MLLPYVCPSWLDQSPPAVAWTRAHQQLPGPEPTSSCLDQSPPAVAWTRAHQQLPGPEPTSSCLDQSPPAVAWTRAHQQLPGPEPTSSCLDQSPPAVAWTRAHQQLPGPEPTSSCLDQSPPAVAWTIDSREQGCNSRYHTLLTSTSGLGWPLKMASLRDANDGANGRFQSLRGTGQREVRTKDYDVERMIRHS